MKTCEENEGDRRGNALSSALERNGGEREVVGGVEKASGVREVEYAMVRVALAAENGWVFWIEKEKIL